MKRAFDIVTAAAALAILAPLLLVLGLLVRLRMGRPVFFCQTRVGQDGRDFRLFKFRTMTTAAGAEHGTFDAGQTRRVTPLGRVLRKTKLDELPQLWNVLRGDMSMVGPRPEVRSWVAVYPERWQRVLRVKPGITDPASIYFRNEEDLLARSANPDALYRTEILPRKLAFYEEYVQNPSLLNDVGILLRTVTALWRGR
ncbi:MAG: sugar transferase [Lentisphaerae bacterium]|nr:sugar transferase [Lentisphaerota bacterium]